MAYFQENMCGTWQEIRQTSIINDVYQDFRTLPWTDSYYFMLNFCTDPIIDDIVQYENIVLSCHFQTPNEGKLFAIFDQFSDKRFLLITDQDRHIDYVAKISEIFPNVETLPWITWHNQLDVAIGLVGINSVSNSPQHFISCLSGRQDIHKSILTAFVLRNFQPQETLCSWHALPSKHHYWQDPNFILPPRLKSLLHDSLLDKPRYVHGYRTASTPPSGRMSDLLDWTQAVFVDCLINVCLESQFNDMTQWRGQSFKLPGPMFTEKTWKPMLAGQCFLPVGQVGSCAALAMHGISFDFLEDMYFDSLLEFDRLEAILEILDKIRLIDRDEIKIRCRASSDQNLDAIKSGDFYKSCQTHNEKSLAKLHQWVNH